jgi:hypothetical protein
MNRLQFPRLYLLAAALTVLATFSTAAWATQFYGVPVFVANDGDVSITFQGGAGAAYNNDLYLDSPSNSLGLLFSNHVTTIGDSINLGTFSAGTELLFRMHTNDGTTEHDYFTGPASLNPDNFPHDYINDSLYSNQLYVGFEDQFGGGDQNYNDMDFSLTNAKAAPEPASICLLAIGASGMLFLKKRKRL